VIRFRKQVSLARLSAIPLIVGVTFAAGSWARVPWQVSVVNAALFVLPVFIAGATLAQWLSFYGIAGILVGLLTPTVVMHHGPRNNIRPPSSGSSITPGNGEPLTH
jgi:hypothetical protein